VNTGLGATRFNRRSAVVAKTNWKGRFDVSSSTVSRETCSKFVEVGKVEISNGREGAEWIRVRPKESRRLIDHTREPPSSTTVPSAELLKSHAQIINLLLL